MAEEIIVTGKTFEDAMAAAQAKYSGVNVQYEILEMPKKGFLGIGSTPAKIKVIIEDEEEEDADLSGIVASIKGLGVATNKGGGDEKPKAEKPKKEKKADKKAEKPEKAEKAEKSEKPVEKKQKTEKKAKSAPVVKEARVIEVTEKEKECALEFANTMLRNMGVDAVAKFTGSEPSGIGGNTYPHMEISGDGAGILIGHHGETLDAIQYLVNLCAHRNGGSSSKEFVKIIVDIEDYRAKREETLRSLARRTAAKAQKYKRNVSLEPMNPFERRIIHSEIQGIENVSTHSVGSDENRKIIVCYDGPDKVDRRRRNGGKPQQKVANEQNMTEQVDATDAELALEALKNEGVEE